MKMPIEQLTNLFRQLAEQEEIIEDIARLLAQAAIGEGTIFLAVFGEMKAVTAAALSGDALSCIEEWHPKSVVTSNDRVFILAKKDEGDGLAGRLSDASLPFAMLCAESKEFDLPEVFLALNLDKGILPAETSSQPQMFYAMAALYVYHNINLMMIDMLSENSY